MQKLVDVDRDALLSAFASADEPKAVKRLAVALAYTDGVPVATLTDRYGIPQSTIYYWLDRFEKQSIEGAITDEARPGRPPALDDDQRSILADALADAPDDHGIDAQEWTPRAIRQFVDRRFGVSYSRGTARRLLAELRDS